MYDTTSNFTFTLDRFYFATIDKNSTHIMFNVNMSMSSYIKNLCFYINYITCPNNLIIGVKTTSPYCFCNNTIYSFYNNLTLMCDLNCPTNMISNGVSCLLCSNLFQLCNTCALDHCISCVSNSNLITGNCSCNIGYFINSSICSLCSNGCLVCTAFFFCITCDSNKLF
jgi:hypothetical protein